MTEESNASAQAPQQFDIQKVYVKDLSLETPNSPLIFAEQWQPQINLQINSVAQQLAEQTFEVVLTLTVTAKQGDKTAYLVEIKQAGLFALKGFPNEQLGPVLGAFCPNLLFPYVREAVDALLIKGGFPPLALKPVNFDAIYMQQLQAQRAASQAETAKQH